MANNDEIKVKVTAEADVSSDFTKDVEKEIKKQSKPKVAISFDLSGEAQKLQNKLEKSLMGKQGYKTAEISKLIKTIEKDIIKFSDTADKAIKNKVNTNIDTMNTLLKKSEYSTKSLNQSDIFKNQLNKMTAGNDSVLTDDLKKRIFSLRGLIGQFGKSGSETLKNTIVKSLREIGFEIDNINKKELRIKTSENLKGKLESIGSGDNARVIEKNEGLKKQYEELNRRVLQLGTTGGESIKGLTRDVGNFEKEVAKSAKTTKTFGGALSDAISKFSKWLLASTIVMQFIRAIRNAITYLKEMDKAMTDVQIVTGLGRQSVEKLRKEYSSLAIEIGATTKEVADASLEYIRQGKSAEESLKLVRDSMMLSKLGNIEAAQSTEYLTAATNAYKKAGLDATSVVDKFISVDNKA